MNEWMNEIAQWMESGWASLRKEQTPMAQWNVFFFFLFKEVVILLFSANTG